MFRVSLTRFHHRYQGFIQDFLLGGGRSNCKGSASGEVIVKVVLACVSTATHMSACEQPRVIWGHVPK